MFNIGFSNDSDTISFEIEAETMQEAKRKLKKYFKNEGINRINGYGYLFTTYTITNKLLFTKLNLLNKKL